MFEHKLKIGKEEVGLAFPDSLSATVDLWFAVAQAQKKENNSATFTKLSAAAIGLGVDRSNPVAESAPEYDISSGDFIAYGNQVIDWLGKNGVRWLKIVNLGAEFLNWCSKELLADEEIVSMEDFTEAAEDRLTG